MSGICRVSYYENGLRSLGKFVNLVVKQVVSSFSSLFSPCSYRVIETLLKDWENSKKKGNTNLSARVPTAFLVLPDFHSCF